MRRQLGEFCFTGVVFEHSVLIVASDYATWTNMQANITSNAMVCDYKMVGPRKCHRRSIAYLTQIDSDYYLPVLMERYFLQNPVGQKRVAAFFK
jgi:hypothetical protein